jgi:hypothetical protein
MPRGLQSIRTVSGSTSSAGVTARGLLGMDSRFAIGPFRDMFRDSTLV